MSLVAQPRPISRYRPPPSRRDLPIPPQWLPRPRHLRKPPMARFVLLSMLLHALFITLFGAPSGGSPEGRAMWGALHAVLAPRAAEPAPEPVAAPAAPPPVVPQPVTDAFPELLERIEVPEPPRDDPLLVPPPSVTPAPPAPPAPPPAIVPPVQLDVPPAIAPRLEAREPSVTLDVAPVVDYLPVEPTRTREPLLAEAPVISAEPAPPEPPKPLAEAPAIESPVIPVAAMASIAHLPSASPGRPIELLPAPEIYAAAAAPAPEVAPPARITDTAPAAAPVPAAPFAATRRPGEAARPEAAAAGDYDPTKPSLDPEALRARAAQIAREGVGNRAALPFPMPPVPERKTALEVALEKARKPDCREAYQSLGLLAVVPLIANEFGEGSCRW